MISKTQYSASAAASFWVPNEVWRTFLSLAADARAGGGVPGQRRRTFLHTWANASALLGINNLGRSARSDGAVALARFLIPNKPFRTRFGDVADARASGWVKGQRLDAVYRLATHAAARVWVEYQWSLAKQSALALACSRIPGVARVAVQGNVAHALAFDRVPSHRLKTIDRLWTLAGAFICVEHLWGRTAGNCAIAVASLGIENVSRRTIHCLAADAFTEHRVPNERRQALSILRTRASASGRVQNQWLWTGPDLAFTIARPRVPNQRINAFFCNVANALAKQRIPGERRSARNSDWTGALAKFGVDHLVAGTSCQRAFTLTCSVIPNEVAGADSGDWTDARARVRVPGEIWRTAVDLRTDALAGLRV